MRFEKWSIDFFNDIHGFESLQCVFVVTPTSELAEKMIRKQSHESEEYKDEGYWDALKH